MHEVFLIQFKKEFSDAHLVEKKTDLKDKKDEKKQEKKTAKKEKQDEKQVQKDIKTEKKIENELDKTEKKAQDNLEKLFKISANCQLKSQAQFFKIEEPIF